MPKQRLSARRRGVVSMAVVVASALGVLYVRSVLPRQTSSMPSSRPAVQSAATSAAYADGQTCARCHEEIARTYAKTGMGQSFARLGSTGGTLQGTSGVSRAIYHQASNRHYTVVERAGVLYQRRHQTGFGDAQTNVVELSADYVVGSGRHARTLLHRYPDGRLVQLPISWYAERGGFWAMSPGYDKPAHLDFRRLINEDCMSCHNGYPRQALTDEGNGPRFVDPLPQGIDCQRCHGPGQNHIDAVRSGDVDAGRRAIVNPKTLGRERQLETCMQCHLESTSSPLPFRIRRYDQASFSYVPGRPLSDHFIYFDHAPGSGRDDKFEIASGAYRLRKSPCFLGSQMTCTTCHDPHDIPRGEAAATHYAAVCQTCHRQVHASGVRRVEAIKGTASCIACHMPKRRTEDAVHVVMTDHFIRRRPAVNLVAPRRELSEAETTYRGEVVPYSPQDAASTPENELYVALAQVLEESNLTAGISRLEQWLVTNRPSRPEPYYELARAYARASNDAADIRWCEEAIRRDPAFANAYKELAAAATRLGTLDQAATALETAIRLRPRDAFSLADLGNVYLQQGRVDDARRVLEQAIALDPVMPRLNNTIGLAELRAGNPARAESFFRAAIQAQPDLAEAQNNLGNVLAGRNAYDEAAFHFEKAIEADPRYTAAHHSYGVVLALSRSYVLAVKELRTAVQLDPWLMQAHLDLADVLSTVGRRDEAAREYEAALRSTDIQIRGAAIAGLNALKQ